MNPFTPILQDVQGAQQVWVWKLMHPECEPLVLNFRLRARLAVLTKAVRGIFAAKSSDKVGTSMRKHSATA